VAGQRRRDARTFWLFVGPFLIGLAICAYLPIGWGAYLSFFDARNTVAPDDVHRAGQLRRDAVQRG
jgi:multiple sugar transport system permease protein